MFCGGLHQRCGAPLHAPATRICLPTQFAQLSLKASRSQVRIPYANFEILPLDLFFFECHTGLLATMQGWEYTTAWPCQRAIDPCCVVLWWYSTYCDACLFLFEASSGVLFLFALHRSGKERQCSTQSLPEQLLQRLLLMMGQRLQLA